MAVTEIHLSPIAVPLAVAARRLLELMQRQMSVALVALEPRQLFLVVLHFMLAAVVVVAVTLLFQVALVVLVALVAVEMVAKVVLRHRVLLILAVALVAVRFRAKQVVLALSSSSTNLAQLQS